VTSKFASSTEQEAETFVFSFLLVAEFSGEWNDAVEISGRERYQCLDVSECIQRMSTQALPKGLANLQGQQNIQFVIN
jgi:hypothetical protein